MTNRVTAPKPVTVSDHVGRAVTRIRRQRGWTQMQLANRCVLVGAEWLSYYVLTKVERPSEGGERRRRISVEDLVALAAALKVTPADLLPGATSSSAAEPNPPGLQDLVEELQQLTAKITQEAHDGHQ